jgi:diaminopimelate decarboxylase
MANACSEFCFKNSTLVTKMPVDALDKVLLLLEQLKDKSIDITHLDLGGGVGIDYEGEQTIDIKAYVDAIISKVGHTEIILEPGRAIVGNAGIFITKVEFLKQNSEHACTASRLRTSWWVALATITSATRGRVL